MSIEIRIATDDDADGIRRVDERAFGFGFSDDEFARSRQTFDLSRFRLAWDGCELVGVAGSFAFEVTLPGGAAVSMGGVTWVSVSATHRRQGVLRRLMDAVHADIDERGEPLAMLGASEGGIYERFGYGIASWMRVIEIAPKSVSMRPEFVPAHHGVTFVTGDDARRHTDAIWDRYRRTRPTEVSRDEAWRSMVAADRAVAQDGLTQAFTLAHRDGYASYRMSDKWNMGLPQHELHLGELAAVTAEAHAALWSVLLTIDLVGNIISSAVPVDDPLPYLLSNHRAVRTINLKDGYWANVRDPATCFAARTYGSDDRLVVESDGVRWAIEGGPDGASCRRVRTKPDLVTDGATLGCLLFGSTPPSQLAAGRRLTGSIAAIRRADAFFATSPAPFCQTHY